MIAGDKANVAIFLGGIIFWKIIQKKAHNITISIFFKERVISTRSLVIAKKGIITIALMIKVKVSMEATFKGLLWIAPLRNNCCLWIFFIKHLSDILPDLAGS